MGRILRTPGDAQSIMFFLLVYLMSNAVKWEYMAHTRKSLKRQQTLAPKCWPCQP